MATLDATIGGSSANSYNSVVEADDYFESRVGGEGWAALTNKDTLLITAGYTMDDGFNYPGYKTSADQSMDWPRVTSDPDLADDVIPDKIKRGHLELAFYLYENGYATVAQSLDSVKVGSIEVDFNEDIPQGLIPENIQTIVYPLGSLTGPASGGNGIVQVPLTR